MKELILYVKKNFEKSENGLMQICITHVLITLSILFIKIAFLFTGRVEGVESFLSAYFYLSSSWEALLHKPWTIISYFFIPKGIMELIFNISWLYSFGRVITSLLGSRRLIILYFIGGVAGGLSFLIVYTFAPLFASANEITIHLTAAVYAVIIGSATFAPNYLFHRFLIPTQIKYIACFLLLLPLVQLANGHIEAVAQLGSALAGYLYIHHIKYMHSPESFSERAKGLFEEMRRTFSKDSQKSQQKPTYTSKTDLQAIFDKIAKQGYHSLSTEEKKRLFEASKES